MRSLIPEFLFNFSFKCKGNVPVIVLVSIYLQFMSSDFPIISRLLLAELSK